VRTILITAILASTWLSPSAAQPGQPARSGGGGQSEWTTPFEPFHIAGNLHKRYVSGKERDFQAELKKQQAAAQTPR
jgi:hypothetical protein